MERRYEKNALYDFEIKILTSGSIKGFLPLSIRKNEENLYLKSFTEGAKVLDFSVITSPSQLLQILEEIILIIEEASNYLILIERFELSKDVIYVEQNRVKIRFIPISGNSEELEDVNLRLLQLIAQIPVVNDICTQYLERVKDKIEEDNPNRRGLLNYIGELKREIYICGWDR